MEYICENDSQDISLDELSEKFRISKTYINNLLKSFCHRSFLDILQDYRHCVTDIFVLFLYE